MGLGASQGLGEWLGARPLWLPTHPLTLSLALVQRLEDGPQQAGALSDCFPEAAFLSHPQIDVWVEVCRHPRGAKMHCLPSFCESAEDTSAHLPCSAIRRAASCLPAEPSPQHTRGDLTRQPILPQPILPFSGSTHHACRPH